MYCASANLPRFNYWDRKKQSWQNVQLEIDELKSIKIEENKQENEQIDNNTIKNFQKYLFLRLNYLKSGQNKISYKSEICLAFIR